MIGIIKGAALNFVARARPYARPATNDQRMRASVRASLTLASSVSIVKNRSIVSTA